MTSLTYTSQAEKNADKALLERAREALDITPGVLRLDECGLWQLKGHRGRITTWGDGAGYLLRIYEMRSKQAWTWARKRLVAVGCVSTQSAEMEGCLRFELETLAADAAGEIRSLAGLYQRQVVSEVERALRIERLANARVGARNADVPSAGGIEPPEARGAVRAAGPALCP